MPITGDPIVSRYPFGHGGDVEEGVLFGNRVLNATTVPDRSFAPWALLSIVPSWFRSKSRPSWSRW